MIYHNLNKDICLYKNLPLFTVRATGCCSWIWADGGSIFKRRFPPKSVIALGTDERGSGLQVHLRLLCFGDLYNKVVFEWKENLLSVIKSRREKLKYAIAKNTDFVLRQQRVKGLSEFCFVFLIKHQVKNFWLLEMCVFVTPFLSHIKTFPKCFCSVGEPEPLLHSLINDLWLYQKHTNTKVPLWVFAFKKKRQKSF